MNQSVTPWWQTRVYVVLLIILAGAPFWWPAVPPLVDLPGHMGRYQVQLEIGSNPFFREYFDFQWSLIANLGIDLLVQIFGPLIGLETTIKAVVIAIPMITVAGLLLIAREAHGRLPATAAFVLPLSIGYPLHFGFVNFSLSMGLALLAFGWWMRLDRLGKNRLRIALFVPISISIWIVHLYGWGLLGLLVGAYEWHRTGWRRTFHAVVRCLPLALPLLMMIIWRGDASGSTSGWFKIIAKLIWLLAALRDEQYHFDIASVVTLLILPILCMGYGWWHQRRGFSTLLALATALIAVAYLCIPRLLLGSAFADMRLTPFLLAIWVLTAKPKIFSRDVQYIFATLGLAFFLLRTGMTTEHLVRLDRDFTAQLEALPHIPRNRRIFAQINLPCQRSWASSRMDHLSSMATVRRGAFVNDQWDMPGAQLLRIHHPQIKTWTKDPTQIARPNECPQPQGNTYDQAMREFPRYAYDYLWLIDFTPDMLPQHDPTLTLIWQGQKSGALYRIGSATQASDTPTGKAPRTSQ